MTLNDYTHHICDRFILLFIAFVGLVGTSYIIVSGNLNCTGSPEKDVSTIFEASFHQPIGIKATPIIEEVETPVVSETEIISDDEIEELTVSD
ncbi:MAG: hypothetical protein HKN68_16440 [Saprospiraceae bacterium]|nr:hypothetical protein [Saprospiraceae bacterium]